jgi:hypothetical protein
LGEEFPTDKILLFLFTNVAACAVLDQNEPKNSFAEIACG